MEGERSGNDFFHKRDNIFLSNSENNTKGNLRDGWVKYTVAPAGGENNYHFNNTTGCFSKGTLLNNDMVLPVI